MNKLLLKATDYMQSLVTNGGPSLTRWLALRVTEAMTFLVALMVFTVCHNVWYAKPVDTGIIAAITTIAVALITATSLNQNTKITLDAKPTGDPSTVETPGAKITTGEQK